MVLDRDLYPSEINSEGVYNYNNKVFRNASDNYQHVISSGALTSIYEAPPRLIDVKDTSCTNIKLHKCKATTSQ